jgi:hypothetical protein
LEDAYIALDSLEKEKDALQVSVSYKTFLFATDAAVK